MQQLRPEAHSLKFLEFRIYISFRKGPSSNFWCLVSQLDPGCWQLEFLLRQDSKKVRENVIFVLWTCVVPCHQMYGPGITTNDFHLFRSLEYFLSGNCLWTLNAWSISDFIFDSFWCAKPLTALFSFSWKVNKKRSWEPSPTCESFAFFQCFIP